MNTGQGWRTWNPNGTFVDRYIGETEKNLTAVFTYYMIRQSNPGAGDGDEPHAVLANLRNAATMKAWLGDVRALLGRAGGFPKRTVVLHVEPDMWGYGEQAAKNDDAATVPVARVGDMAALARRVVSLRDQLAPNVLLAYHASGWGTGVDLSINDPSLARSADLGRKAGRFYRSLKADFDVTFTDWSDRDAAFKRAIYGAGPEAWWTSADRARALRFLRAYTAKARQRVAVWQLPLGNTVMRAMDDTWGHYQDNHVQWLLGRDSRKHLRALRDAGAIGFLFGGGAPGTTCACDATGDGRTNPAPINGNTRASYSADDDGGFFRRQARAYYGAGAVGLR
ncbi:MAG TPA: hypothetical protein VJT75_15500 [Thermoleophilaceae bacterium]|nr:hypothetical protein [Thermoleophilaceae bacterium]